MKTFVLCLFAMAWFVPGASNQKQNMANQPQLRPFVSDASPVPWPGNPPPTGLTSGPIVADASPVPWPTGGGGKYI